VYETRLGTRPWPSVLILDNARTWTNNESKYYFKVRKCEQNNR